jgi:DNA-binding CsgD family transcriptional regulator/predicted negative regulator of RcsB-dependent stress response
MYTATANLSARQPLLVCIDDLHWCDLASLRWLAYLLPRMEDLPVIVVASTRPPESSSHGAPIAQLVEDPLTILLRPAPLSESGSAAVVRDLLSAAADPAFCAACHAESGGNPLWLRELVRAVAAQGLEPDAAAARTLRDLGAQAIRRTVVTRLERLPRAAVAMARAVAVLGDGADFDYAAALAQLDGDEAFEAVLALQGADVLRTQPRLAFVHPVVRAAVEGDLAPLERSRGHRRAASLLAHAGAEPERVAAHLLMAPAEGDSGVVETLRAAARDARTRGAAESSVAYLRRALAEPPDDAVRPELLIELGLGESLVNEPAAAEHLAQALDLLADPDLRAQVGFTLGRTLYTQSRVEEAVRAFERALAELPAVDTPLRRMLEAARAHTLFTLAGTARLQLPRTSAAEPPADLGGRWLEALGAYVDAHSGASAEQAAERAERALAGGLFVEQDNGGGGLAAAALVLMHADRDVRPVLDDALTHAHAHGSVLAFAAVKVFCARAAFLRGELVDAETDAVDALSAVEQWNLAVGARWAAAYLADALMEQGRLDEAARALARGVPRAGEPLPAFALRHWLVDSAARLRVLRGDLRGGVADLLDAGRRMEELGRTNPAFMAWRSQAAIALLALGERDRAAALAADELALSRRWGAPRALAASLRAMGLAEGGAAGRELLEEAVAVTEDSPARLEHAKALVELGAALRRANRRVDAREQLREGLDVALRHGAVPVVERAETELLATGARARRLLLRGAEALTASERRVAGLAAQGATNREIAQSLFVTTKTVEVHLTNAYRKLDISSRVQLSGALAAAA